MSDTTPEAPTKQYYTTQAEIISARAGFDEAIACMFAHPVYRTTYLFYAHIIAQCKIRFSPSLPAVAGVGFVHDHYELVINPYGSTAEDGSHTNGFNELPLQERMGVLKHEMLHILNGHTHRRQDRDHEAFNISADTAINQHIERSHLPEYALYPDNFPANGADIPLGLSAEQYYELLPRDPNSKPQCNGTGKSGTGKQLDDHSSWESNTADKDLQDDVTKTMLDKSINSTQKSRGNLPSNLDAMVALFTRSNEVNWKHVTRHIMGNRRADTRRTIQRLDRRLPECEWIKGKTKDRKFDTLVISDVSGSVSDKALIELWGEIIHLAKFTKSTLQLIQIDTAPHTPTKLSPNTRVMPRQACGGTILAPAIEKARDSRIHFDLLIVTTDGYIDKSDIDAFAATGKPVIWLIESGGQLSPYMQTGKMRAFQLKK